MKPHFHKVPVGIENSFSIRYDVQPNFGTLWHYHTELELNYIIKGEGVKFIGDSISNFTSGDMILLGENLPHTWHCNEEYFRDDPTLKVEAFVLHFSSKCLGNDFLKLPEAYMIPQLFEQAKKGLLIYGKARRKLADLLQQALGARGIERLILMISMLRVLAETGEKETISSAYAFHTKHNAYDMLRLDRIYSYSLENYKKDISLEEVAAIANMSVTSFCRYFKTATKKSFFTFLIEIRISHACRALIEDKLPIEMICFQCGFNNVSNFYRHFKKVMGITPYKYKEKYLLKPTLA